MDLQLNTAGEFQLDLMAQIDAMTNLDGRSEGEGGFGGKEKKPSFPPAINQDLDLRIKSKIKIGVEETLEGIKQRSPKQKERDQIWNACEEVLGFGPGTKSEHALWGKMISSLLSAGATPEKIRTIARNYHQEWPGMAFTITAIEKHYSYHLRTGRLIRNTGRNGRMTPSDIMRRAQELRDAGL